MLKPFLGIDLTEDKNNTQLHGDALLIQRPSAGLSQALESSSESANATLEKSKLPLPLRIIQYVCGFSALLMATGILRADVSLMQGYRNAPWIYWGAAICAVIWLILWLWSKQKANTVLREEESTMTLSNLERVSRAIYTELGVPADAKQVDILSFYYKTKDGNIKVCEKGMQIGQYLNPVFHIFSDSDNLYLANLEGKYAFPLSSVVRLHTVRKHIRIAGWNKEEKFNEGMYKQYKLTTDNFGCIHCKHYYILEINFNGESWGIYFPPYELPVFEEMAS